MNHKRFQIAKVILKKKKKRKNKSKSMQILPENCRGKSFQLICGASIILMSKSGISIIGKESYRLMFLIKKDTNISSKMLTN